MNDYTDSRINFVPTKSALTWDEYFMLQAMIAASKSKDPSTKVGCVFVDKNNHQITMGYNGFVAGIDESKIPWGNDPSTPLEFQKYGYVVHSEANAILHSSRSLEGSRAYVTLFPCNECAKLIASSKIKEVIYLSDKHHMTESNRIAKKIFELSGVTFRKLNFPPDALHELTKHLENLLTDI